MTRGKKALINSSSRFLYEIVAIVCSFILPRLILSYYGSAVNGLVLSITRLLAISTFIDAAIGGVTRAAFYKPLSNNDTSLISKIYVAANKFYKKVSLIFVAYTLMVACFLPTINNEGFGFEFIFFLTLTTSFSTFIQFIIGATNTVLIYADQKVFLITLINTATIILNTVATAVLIRLNCSIQVVKLTTSIIFAVRPIFAYFYCKSHYSINKKAIYEQDPIPNKWSGFGHQIAETVRSNGDVVILTVLSVYSNVSIYAVYALITDGLTKFLEALRSGMGPSFGNMLVTEPIDKVRKRFSLFEWVMNVSACILFTCAAILIVPFVTVYTHNISDAQYAQPLFGLLIVISAMLHNMKNPYLMIVFAAGHYKETQKHAYVEMCINILLSVILVRLFGLNGVAIGAIVAMLYRIGKSALYVKDSIIQYRIQNVIAKLGINTGVLFGSNIISRHVFTPDIQSYIQWVAYATVVFVCVSIITITLYTFVFRDDAKAFVAFARRVIKGTGGKTQHDKGIDSRCV